jgi:hypothetical protein
MPKDAWHVMTPYDAVYLANRLIMCAAEALKPEYEDEERTREHREDEEQLIRSLPGRLGF